MRRDDKHFLRIACAAARAAAKIILEGWKRPRLIDYKGAVDLVTPVDRAAEETIVRMLQREFADHSILAEEETVYSGAAEHRWIIDPLDGTTNFAHGYPQLAISIALELRQQIILGVVYDPLRREMFSAVSGEGAKVNGVPLRVSTIELLDRALLGTGFPYDRREHAEFYLGFFSAFLTRCQGIRRSGSAALDLCYVASGRLDGFWELKLKPWDVAAGTLIVTEAGGRISDFYDQPFSIWGGQTLASNGLVHGEMAQITGSCLHGHVD